MCEMWDLPRLTGSLPVWLAFLFLAFSPACGDDDSKTNENSNSNDNQGACGNGHMEGLEECDDGAANSDSFPNACRTDCTVARCGDGVVDSGEECDDGPSNSDKVPDACRTTCALPRCGDGLVDSRAGEACDCGDESQLVPPSCQGPNSDEPGSLCHTDCTIVGCGDGVLREPEECEPGLFFADTCQDFGYYTGTLGCLANCRFDVSGCQERCGDGLINGMEECDGAPPPNLYCVDLGFDGGRLGCNNSCVPNVSKCERMRLQPLSMPLTSGEQVTTVWGTSSRDLWVGTESMRILRFNGSAWSEYQTERWVEGIWGFSSKDVYAILGGIPYRLSCGQFRDMGQGLNAQVYALWGTAPDNLYAVGSSGGFSRTAIYHWDGQRWTRVPVELPGELRGIWGSSASDIFAVGYNEDASMLALHYNGSEWGEFESVGSGLSSVWGTGPNNVWAVGGNRTLLHYNGSSWTEWDAPMEEGRSLTAVFGTGEDDVWAVGTALLHFDGERWTNLLDDNTGDNSYRAGWASSPRAAYFVPSYSGRPLSRWTGSLRMRSDAPGVGVTAYWSTPLGTVYAAGLEGEYAALRSWRGDVWSSFSPSSVGGSPLSIWGHDEDELWILLRLGWWLTSGSRILSWHNGVFSVQLELPETISGNVLRSIWGSAADDIWAVGGTSEVYRYNGTSWRTEAIGVAGVDQLSAIFGFSSGDIYAGGYNGTLLHYDGTAWSAMSSPTSRGINWLWGTAPNELFAVGDQGTVLRYDGVQWTEMESAQTSVNLRAVSGRSPDDFWVVGDTGTALHFDGVAFSPVLLDTSDDLFGVLTRGSETFFSTNIGHVIRIYRTRACASAETNCGNMLDEDCDGLTDCADPDCAGTAPCQAVETLCDDHFDNDGDGLTDGADPDCSVSIETSCTDRIDNDCDGLIDCADQSECASMSFCEYPEQSCQDQLDNDGDGLFDCADPDCQFVGTETICDDGVDNDCDGLVDCSDPDCSVYPCEHPETTCADGIDNDGDGDTDCEDMDCSIYPCEHPETTCTDDIDNDGDGDTDCADMDCSGYPCEYSETTCTDGIDNDGDGDTDCEDMNCVTDPSCIPMSCEPLTDISCGSNLTGDTTWGPQNIQAYGCVGWLETGPESYYRFSSPSAALVTVTLEGMTADLDLFVLAPGVGGECDAWNNCLWASSTGDPVESISFDAIAGQTYFFIVDGYDGDAGPYEISVSCN